MMKHLKFLSTLALIALPALAQAQMIAEPALDMITLSGDMLIPMTIEGQSMQLRVDPDIGEYIVLNSASGARLGKKPSMFGGVHRIGPVSVWAFTNVVSLSYGDKKEKKRVFLMKDRDSSAIGDGIAAPAALSYKKVRLILRPAQAGERTAEFVLSKDGKNVILMIGGQPIPAGFNLLRDETLATADTGLLISNAQRGSFSGVPQNAVIRMGVERPVRPMALADPLQFSGLMLDRILVRVSDFGDASTIPEGSSVDDDEIIVTAASKKKPRHALNLGRDFLKNCSSITYDFPAQKVRLSCIVAG